MKRRTVNPGGKQVERRTRRRWPPSLWLAILIVALAACGRPSPTASSVSKAVEQGRALYAANCFRCHGGETGGQMTDIPPPHNASGHTWHHPDQQLLDIVDNGLSFAVAGQPTMPAFKGVLSQTQEKAILAYIKTLWTDEQRSFQATVTAANK